MPAKLANDAKARCASPPSDFRPGAAEYNRYFRYNRGCEPPVDMAEIAYAYARRSGFNVGQRQIDRKLVQGIGPITVTVTDKLGGSLVGACSLARACLRMFLTAPTDTPTTVTAEVAPGQLGPSCGYQAANKALVAKSVGFPAWATVSTADVSQNTAFFEAFNEYTGLVPSNEIKWIGGGDILEWVTGMHAELNPGDVETAWFSVQGRDGAVVAITKLLQAAQMDPATPQEMHMVINDRDHDQAGHHWIHMSLRVGAIGEEPPVLPSVLAPGVVVVDSLAML